MTQVQTDIEKDTSFGGKSFAEAFNEVTDQGADVPAGTYTGILTSVKWKVLDSKKVPGETLELVEWEYSITDGEQAKRKVWLSDFVKPTTLWLLKNHMTQLGYSGSVKSQEDVKEFLNSCVGKLCDLNLSYREYQGKSYAQGEFFTVNTLDKTANESDVPF